MRWNGSSGSSVDSTLGVRRRVPALEMVDTDARCLYAEPGRDTEEDVVVDVDVAVDGDGNIGECVEFVECVECFECFECFKCFECVVDHASM